MSYRTFAEFYPFYLSQHRNPVCRALHVIGVLVSLAWLVRCAAKGTWVQIPWLLVWGYGLAWIGHFFFERNRPATFQYPLYSFRGDLKMFVEVVSGRRRLRD